MDGLWGGSRGLRSQRATSHSVAARAISVYSLKDLEEHTIKITLLMLSLDKADVLGVGGDVPGILLHGPTKARSGPKSIWYLNTS